MEVGVQLRAPATLTPENSLRVSTTFGGLQNSSKDSGRNKFGKASSGSRNLLPQFIYLAISSDQYSIYLLVSRYFPIIGFSIKCLEQSGSTNRHLRVTVSIYRIFHILSY
jgi:hypothetical protein